MRITRRAQIFWSLLLVLFLSQLPYVAETAAAEEMISTSVVVEQLSRQQAETKIHNILSKSDVRNEFVRRGVSPEEVDRRIAGLSDQELMKLYHQMDAARAGGDVITILVIVVLVLLAIFLVKRI